MASFSACGLPGVARGEERCPKDPHGNVVLRSGDLDVSVVREIGDHLRRSLAHRNMAVCTDEEPAAVILDIAAAPSGVTITVSIDEASLHKTASRDLEVTTIPPDARPLAIAQAADELLRVTWPERFAEEARPAPPPAPPVASPAPEPALPEPAPTRMAIGIGLGGEAFGSGHAQLGPDVDVLIAPVTWLALGARGGVRTSASRTATFGEHDTSTLVGSAGASFRVRLARAFALDIGPRVSVMRFAFDASPRAGFVAREEHAVAVCAMADARAFVVPVEPLYVSLALSLGAPIRAAHAVAGGERVHEMNGAVGGAQLAGGVAF